MDVEQAKATLEKHGYKPGAINPKTHQLFSTSGMPEPARSEVKAALAALKEHEQAEARKKRVG